MNRTRRRASLLVMRETPAATLSNRLEWVRDHFNVSRRELAERSGLSVATLASASRIGRASDAVLLKVSKAFGLRFAWLATGAGPPFEGEGAASTASTFDAVRYFAGAIGLRAAVIDAVVAESAPGASAEALLDRVRAADADARLRQRSPAVADYEAAAAFARSLGLPTDAIVSVRERALGGEFSSAYEVLVEMRAAVPATPPPSAPLGRPMLTPEELLELGYRRTRLLRSAKEGSEHE